MAINMPIELNITLKVSFAVLRIFIYFWTFWIADIANTALIWYIFFINAKFYVKND